MYQEKGITRFEMKPVEINSATIELLFLIHLMSKVSGEELMSPVLKVGAGSLESAASLLFLPKLEILEVNQGNKALRYFQNNWQAYKNVTTKIGDITKYNIGKENYIGCLCSDIVSLLPREEGELVVRKVLDSLKPGGVFYFDFGGLKTWDFRANKQNYDPIGQNSYRLVEPEPCDYGGFHKYLTLYSEDEIRGLLKGADILLFTMQISGSDFSDGRPAEHISVIGQKASQH